jgi:hypothetical protein
MSGSRRWNDSGPKLPDGAKPVPGVDGYYATLTGEIWCTRGECPRRLKGRGTLYERHSTQEPGGTVHMLAHRMVLLAFVGPPPAGKGSRIGRECSRHECGT